MLTGQQIRAARALLRWSLEDLAQASGVSRNAIQRIEQVDGVPGARATSLAAVESAFQRAGVVAFGADDRGGLGVRLTK